ncbi:hypothetical protein [Agromyces sp. H66]|uniref:hypothetical protein n=1 Tax=Agromyces sp. H66 TaxID=2529859 RepID=UPI0010AAC7C1|nr:hypothetical protein [Agromyces sp. H66]
MTRPAPLSVPLAALALASTLLLSACGAAGGDERSDVAAEPSSVDATTEASTTSHDHTTEDGDSVALPAGWPEDLPLVEGRVVSATVDGTTLATYVAVTDRDAAMAALDDLEQRGWTRESFTELGATDFITVLSGPYAPTLNYRESSSGNTLAYILTMG